MEIVTIGGLPVYNALVTDEGTGMFRISLVDDPAVQSNFMAFDAARRVPLYAVSDEEKRLVLGVVMRADFPIYRRDTGFGEYYVIYKPDAIRSMAEKYLLEGRQNAVNLMHEEGTDVDGVQMVQYFIKGNGIAPEGFDDIADGSLFAEFHVVNDAVWAEIKAGTYRGFSLEGVFDLEPERDLEVTKKIVDDLDGNFSNQTPNTHNEMSKLKKIRAALQAVFAMFGAVTTDKGVLAWDGDEDLKAGDKVFIEDQDGNRTDAADGDYITEDGKTIVVVDGAVAEIRDPEAEVAPAAEPEPEQPAEMGRVDTEDGTLLYEGDGDLEAGTPVFVERDGETVPAPDGEYRTADGKVIRVAEGVVAEIIDPEAEVAPEAPDTRDEELAALRAENEALRAEVEQLKAQPAARPAHEEVAASAEIPVTGNKGLDRLARLARSK